MVVTVLSVEMRYNYSYNEKQAHAAEHYTAEHADEDWCQLVDTPQKQVWRLINSLGYVNYSWLH